MGTHTMFQISGFSMLKTAVLLGMLLSVTATGAPKLEVDRVLQTLYETKGSMPQPRELITALACEGVEINVIQATHAVRKFTPCKKRRRMPAASTGNHIKAMQEKIMQERAAILAKHPEYRTWAEYMASKKRRRMLPGPKKMPAVSIDNHIKAMQEKIMQERAAILAKHPEYNTWAEYIKYHRWD